MTRQPVVFAPHGGGPWPVLPLNMLPAAETASLAAYMRSIAELPPEPPKALLVVSAHWEAPVPTVNTGAHPGMLYDYGGFPDEAYRLQWPAPGDPAVARRVVDLLDGAGFRTATDDQRGYDHGTFVPLLLAYPQPTIPTVQLSLIRTLDPGEHIAMGRALTPLRDEGVFIIGSGNSFHNLRALFSGDRRFPAISKQFDDWLNETVTSEASVRDRRLAEWTSAPAARLCHPREEHLIPLMVCAGAAGDDPGHVTWKGTMQGLELSAHHFGA